MRNLVHDIENALFWDGRIFLQFNGDTVECSDAHSVIGEITYDELHYLQEQYGVTREKNALVYDPSAREIYRRGGTTCTR